MQKVCQRAGFFREKGCAQRPAAQRSQNPKPKRISIKDVYGSRPAQKSSGPGGKDVRRHSGADRGGGMRFPQRSIFPPSLQNFARWTPPISAAVEAHSPASTHSPSRFDSIRRDISRCSFAPSAMEFSEPGRGRCSPETCSSSGCARDPSQWRFSAAETTRPARDTAAPIRSS